jgi:hypothetical protein
MMKNTVPLFATLVLLNSGYTHSHSEQPALIIPQESLLSMVETKAAAIEQIVTILKKATPEKPIDLESRKKISSLLSKGFDPANIASDELNKVILESLSSLCEGEKQIVSCLEAVIGDLFVNHLSSYLDPTDRLLEVVDQMIQKVQDSAARKDISEYSIGLVQEYCLRPLLKADSKDESAAFVIEAKDICENKIAAWSE